MGTALVHSLPAGGSRGSSALHCHGSDSPAEQGSGQEEQKAFWMFLLALLRLKWNQPGKFAPPNPSVPPGCQDSLTPNLGGSCGSGESFGGQEWVWG